MPTFPFIDSRVIPIRMVRQRILRRGEPPLRATVKDGTKTGPASGASSTATLQLEKSRTEASTVTWTVVGGVVADVGRALLDEAYGMHPDADRSAKPELLEVLVQVFEDRFINLRTRWGWSIDPQRAEFKNFAPVSTAAQLLALRCIDAIFDAEAAPRAETFGFENIGFAASDDHPRGRQYMRRYNNYILGEDLGAVGRVVRTKADGSAVHLRWQFSRSALPADTSLLDERLRDLLWLDGRALAYSAALHVATMRVERLLENAESSELAADSVRRFLEEIAISTTYAETYLGWVDDEQKEFMNRYAKINDFERRYRHLMDLRLAVSELGTRLAAKESSRSQFVTRIAAAVLSAAGIASVFKNLNDLVYAPATSNAPLFWVAIGVCVFFVGLLTFPDWKSRLRSNAATSKRYVTDSPTPSSRGS